MYKIIVHIDMVHGVYFPDVLPYCAVVYDWQQQNDISIYMRSSPCRRQPSNQG